MIIIIIIIKIIKLEANNSIHTNTAKEKPWHRQLLLSSHALPFILFNDINIVHLLSGFFIIISHS